MRKIKLENLKNKASEYSKYTDFNLSNYKDTNILKTNHYSFYDLLEIHNLFQILQKLSLKNILVKIFIKNLLLVMKMILVY